MTSKERVKKTIHFECPDRVPVMHSYLPGAVMCYGEKLQQIFCKYSSDFGYSDIINTSKFNPAYYKGTWKDEWDCIWENEYEGILGQVKYHPLSDWRNLTNYKFPDPLKSVNWREAKDNIDSVGGKRYIFGEWFIFFERMHFLRGYENLLIDLIEMPKQFTILADRIFDYNCKLIKKWLELPIDGIFFGDDWGDQRQILINPDIWRKFFKPYYKEVFSLVKREGRDVFFHSDGYIMEIIPDLIEIGVDVLNPQFSCHNLSELGRLVSGKVCICSDIDRQYLLPYGTPEEIEENIKEVIRIFGSHNGGLIGRAEIGADVPLENAEAAYRAFYEHGSVEKESDWSICGS